MSWIDAAIDANTAAAFRTPRFFEPRQRGAAAATNAAAGITARSSM
jgi:hypothetical protein